MDFLLFTVNNLLIFSLIFSAQFLAKYLHISLKNHKKLNIVNNSSFNIEKYNITIGGDKIQFKHKPPYSEKFSNADKINKIIVAIPLFGFAVFTNSNLNTNVELSIIVYTIISAIALSVYILRIHHITRNYLNTHLDIQSIVICDEYSLINLKYMDELDKVKFIKKLNQYNINPISDSEFNNLISNDEVFLEFLLSLRELNRKNSKSFKDILLYVEE